MLQIKLGYKKLTNCILHRRAQLQLKELDSHVKTEIESRLEKRLTYRPCHKFCVNGSG